MIPDFTQVTAKEAEEALRSSIASVELIGQLPLSEKDFAALCQVIKRTYARGRVQLIDRISPAVYVTSMVFTARYSGENVRNFWRPYAKLVWGLSEASQTFQNDCRKAFVRAIGKLSREYDMVFPQRTPGDVVRPVYRHAIIPYYLQDDFAEWMKERWKDILEIPPSELVEQLRFENSLRYLPPTLRRFIEGDETADTARELITTIATAASMYAGGQAPDTIDTLLSGNPIERSLWQELLNVYRAQEAAVHEKQRKAAVDWVWSVDRGEMQVRIRNLLVAGAVEPDRLVWVGPDEEPADSEIETRLLPWKQEDGWLVDSSLLDLGPLDGKIALVSEDGSVIDLFSVPKLPADRPVMVFRRVQQGALGFSVDLDSGSVSDGLWLVTMTKDVLVTDESGKTIGPLEDLPVPAPLSTLAGHKTAGLYELKLPARFVRGDLEIAILESRGSSISTAKIISGEDLMISGLSNSVPSVFTGPDFDLVLDGVPAHIIQRATLWLQNQTTNLHFRLGQLQAEGVLRTDKSRIEIALGSLVPNRIATYEVQIRIGLRPLLSAAPMFGYLPGVQILPPDPTEIYSPVSVPSCIVFGVDREAVHGRASTLVEQTDTGEVRVTWRDVRDDPELQIRQGRDAVHLKWALPRTHAWIAPLNDVYTPETLMDATLRVISTASQIDFVDLWVAGQQARRRVELDAKGQYSSKLRQDPLFDMIREQRSSSLTLLASMGRENWQLAQVQKSAEISQPEIAVEVDASDEVLLIFRCQLGGAWEGSTDFVVFPIGRPDQQVVVGHASLLEEEHVFVSALPDGHYQFQLVQQDKPLLDLPLTFSIGRSQDVDSIDVSGLQPYVGEGVDRPIPRYLRDDFIRLCISEFSEADGHLPVHLRYRLATMDAAALSKQNRSDLRRLWSSLAILLDANWGRYSDRTDGLFPAWVVLDHPLHMKLILPRKHIPLTVYPQRASYRAEHGVGYCLLKVRGRDAEADGIYVQWDIDSRKERYDVFLGLPDKKTRDYSDIDQMDTWPLKQCGLCGELLITRRTERDQYIYDAHKHGRPRPELTDITYDLDLIAQISPSRIHKDLRYRDGPTSWIDRSAAVRMIDGELPTEVLGPDNPISSRGYRSAASRFIIEYKGEINGPLHQWLANRDWQRSFGAIEQLMEEGAIDIPAFGPARRLLSVMKWDGGSAWLNFDKQCLMLALLLRGQVYARPQIGQLLGSSDFKTTDLVLMTDIAALRAPNLLDWALAWSETMYVHARS
jgi:hypothetical protein